jgi:uncharacterized protein (DUF924 family)
MATKDDILRFWLDDVGEKGWYGGGTALDRTIRDRFLPLWEDARLGRLRDWCRTAEGALACLIVLDQFPRNMFRGDPRSFATDPLARAVARDALDRKFDRQAEGRIRQFYYLPFMHSEDPADQDLSVALMSDRMRDAEHVLHARAHREVIRRFGRFPFRNAALGRETTAEEQAFLDGGAYPALVREMREAMQSTHGSPSRPPS